MLAVMRAYFEGMSTEFNIPRSSTPLPSLEHLARIKQHCQTLRSTMQNSSYFELSNVKYKHRNIIILFFYAFSTLNLFRYFL